MSDDVYDVTVKGEDVPRHFRVNLTPQAAAAIRRIVSSFRQHCIDEPGWFGLHEDEDEALEQLVEALTPDEEDETADARV